MHIMSSKHREGPHNHQHTTPKPRQDPLTSPTPNTSRPILRHMLIHTMCRSCLGSGTRVDIYAHTTYGQALAPRTCPDCHGTGRHTQPATTHPTQHRR